MRNFWTSSRNAGQDDGATTRGGPWRTWGPRLLGWAAVLTGASVGSSYLGLDRLLPGAPARARLWLPTLLVLGYALCWLGRRLCQLLQPTQGPSAFPDIDTAWKEATQELAREGIDVTTAPLFLVLGRPERGGRALFTAAFAQQRLRHAPVRPDSPFQVFAHPEALILTCPGASLMGYLGADFAKV